MPSDEEQATLEQLNPTIIPVKKNKGGRPVGTGKNLAPFTEKQKLADEARKFAHVALSTLVDIAKNGSSESARVTAATTILERGYGRPVQTTEHTGVGGGSVEITHSFEMLTKSLDQMALAKATNAVIIDNPKQEELPVNVDNP